MIEQVQSDYKNRKKDKKRYCRVKGNKKRGPMQQNKRTIK